MPKEWSEVVCHGTPHALTGLFFWLYQRVGQELTGKSLVFTVIRDRLGFLHLSPSCLVLSILRDIRLSENDEEKLMKTLHNIGNNLGNIGITIMHIVG